MNIVSMKIKNFKTFRDVTIDFNKNFNVLIGKNNIGKTTIIEAMQLWKKCYDLNVQVKEDKFYATSKNISFSEFEFLRIADAKDLFYAQKGKMSTEIILAIQSGDKIYHLGFRITKPGHINNAYFQVEYIEKEEFTNFEKNASEMGVKLSKMIAFSSTRPLSNIVVKEPYMNIGQVRSKINKGKGYEVLRNKIIKDKKIKKDIEEHLKNIFQKDIEFIETGGNSKEYIKLLVSIDGEKSDVLAQGSGFLQIVDIFSSFEFSDAQLYILLIDEPDSHIHADLQGKLINQFRTISKSQIFVITHNEKFMNNVADQEIIFVNDNDKTQGLLKPLQPGMKKFVIEDLVGNYSDFQKLNDAEKIILVEGFNDKKRLQELLDKYICITNQSSPSIYICNLNGIDTLEEKLRLMTELFKEIKPNAEYILIRDTDCIPINEITKIEKQLLSNMHVEKKSVIFHEGYEFESTLFSEQGKLVTLLAQYYGVEQEFLTQEIIRLKRDYILKAKSVCDGVYETLNSCFNRQKEKRNFKFTFKDFIENITEVNYQHIMNKSIIDFFLHELHECILMNYTGKKSVKKLDNSEIYQRYLNNIERRGDFYQAHLEILDRIINN